MEIKPSDKRLLDKMPKDQTNRAFVNNNTSDIVSKAVEVGNEAFSNMKSGRNMSKFTAEQIKQLSELMDAKIAPVNNSILEIKKNYEYSANSIDELKKLSENLTKAIVGDISHIDKPGIAGSLEIIKTKQDSLVSKEYLEQVSKTIETKISRINGFLAGLSVIGIVVGAIFTILNYIKTPSAQPVVSHQISSDSKK